MFSGWTIGRGEREIEREREREVISDLHIQLCMQATILIIIYMYVHIIHVPPSFRETTSWRPRAHCRDLVPPASEETLMNNSCYKQSIITVNCKYFVSKYFVRQLNNFQIDDPAPHYRFRTSQAVWKYLPHVRACTARGKAIGLSVICCLSA